MWAAPRLGSETLWWVVSAAQVLEVQEDAAVVLSCVALIDTNDPLGPTAAMVIASENFRSEGSNGA